jgi:hypothetical protein
MEKKIICFVLIILSVLVAKSQESCFDCLTTKPLDFTVLIDGKLPLVCYGKAYFYKDSVQYAFLFRSNYGRIYPTLGKFEEKRFGNIVIQDNTIMLPEERLSIFDSLPDTTHVYFEIVWEIPIAPYHEKIYFYEWMCQLYSFKRLQLLLITNFNIRKQIYNVYPKYDLWQTEVTWQKEYGKYSNFKYKKLKKKVFQGLYPRYYKKYKKRGKVRPVY